jgi:glycosyltransferase involved in cell wall biosynthesis
MEAGQMGATGSNGDVAVVIPALNESPVIGEVIAGLRTRFPLVILVDDGSWDGTAQVARSAGARVARHGVNLGQGGALRTGLAAALRLPQVQWIVTFDADGQHQPDDAAALIDRARRGDVDIVLGTRFGDQEVEAGLAKRLLLKAALVYTRAETKLPLTDTHNGLRAMSRSFAEGLNLRERGMGHATEILDHVARSGARWVEVPVHIRYTDYSKAKGQPMINSVNILFDSWFR